MNPEYTYWFWLVMKFIIGFSLIIGYFFWTGKNQLSKMTPVDLIGNFIMGGVVGGVIYNTDIPILKYIAVLIIGLSITYTISYLGNKYSKAREITIGKSLIIIKKGKFQYDVLKDNAVKIDIVDLLSRLQLKGYKGFSDIQYLQLEPNGDIIVFDDVAYPSVIVFRQGEWISSAIDRISIDVEQLENTLKDIDKSDIIFIEYHDNQLNVVLSNDYKEFSLN